MDHDLCVHRLSIPLEFPAGLAPGAGRDLSNSLLLAVDGRGRPILRGSSLAGALRHAVARLHDLPVDPLDPPPLLRLWFGEAFGADRGRESPLRVADCLLDVGRHGGVLSRTHNAIERHDGGPRDGGLFRIGALPPGTTTTVLLHLCSADDGAVAFLQELLGIFARGLTLGGSVARGVGMASLAGPARLRTFQLAKPEDRVAWLDESWAWRDPERPHIPESGVVLEPAALDVDLTVTLQLGIPRGQDLCVADGRGAEHEAEPQRVRDAKGVERWRLPGSALRGVLRGWMTRLAARGRAKIRDSVARYQSLGRAKGDEFGWGFRGPEQRRDVQSRLREDPGSLARILECPIEHLFGSLFHASRLLVSDALSVRPAQPDQDCSVRMHVAVDRISGGARDGLLFDHQALLPGVEFVTTITIRDAAKHEAEWLVQSLRAMELGLLRFGSSKSVGRLCLAGPVLAKGAHANVFSALQAKEVRR